MGIRSKAKKIKQMLPIVGSGGNTPPRPSAPTGSPVQASAPSQPAVAPPETGRGSQDVEEYLKNVVAENAVTLFMKGSPNSPQCGFSANAAGILKSYGSDWHHVNVIADPEVRQGIKDFSNWPTIPQIYIGGEFIGGSDILMQMHQAGELAELIEAAKK